LHLPSIPAGHLLQPHGVVTGTHIKSRGMRQAVHVALLAGVKIFTGFLWGNLGGDQLGDLGLEDWIILKLMFRKENWGFGLHRDK